jgi:acetolactate synthase-1/2/3 large subunit
MTTAPAPAAGTTAARVIAERLARAGCTHAFGMPGGEVLSLVAALEAAGITFVLAKHENAAGFMAEGHWHLTGRPPVLVTTIGPGLANAVNVTLNALQDQVPLIVLSGGVDPAEALTYTHQVLDHTRLMAPVTKASFTATPGGVAVMIDKALAIANDDRPGPVHIDLPIALADAAEPARPDLARVMPSPVAPAPGPALDQARAWLAEAERPIVVAGIDVLRHGAAETLAMTCRRLGLPLITSYKAKGVLPEDDPLALGGAGLSPKADNRLLPLIGQSDLVLLVGYDPIEMRVGWRDPWGPDKRVVELTAAPNHHYMHQASFTFVGHVGAGLAALADGIDPRPRWPGGEPSAVRAALRADFAPGEAWGPAGVVAALRDALPADAVVTVDSGAHRILLSQQWTCPAPRTLLQSTAFCTMGCALPLGIGAKLADPDRPVVAVVGDGGLEMGLGELATARDRGLGLVVVVLADESLALIDLKQRARQLPSAGVDFGATDFAAVAEAMGGHGAVATDAAGLADAVVVGLAADRPTVIACPVDKHAYRGAF